MKGGPIYDKKIATEICLRLASGESLLHVIESEKEQAEAEGRESRYPGYSTLMLWLVDGNHGEWRDMYVQAKRASGHADVDKLADVVRKLENEQLDHRAASQMISALTWMAERKEPRSYSIKQQIDHISSDKSMSPTRIELVALDDDREDTPSS